MSEIVVAPKQKFGALLGMIIVALTMSTSQDTGYHCITSEKKHM
jgi:hypothetical protein